MLLATTLLSLAVAIVMTGVAWRLARDEQRRSDARVADLAADLYHDDSPAPVPVNELFAPDAQPRTKGSLVHALGIGVVVVGTLIALLVVFTGGSSERPVTPVVKAASDQPGALELTALAHDRVRNELTVRGIVRNPSGASIGPLMAGVSVFNQQGDLVASGRAPIERQTLEAGVESRFVVRIADAGDVYRYRISFTVDNRTVAHVDRRDRATTVQLP
jgi:hypothetical protein